MSFMKKLLFILSVGCLFMVNNLYAQVTGNVSIENVGVVGSDVFFDIYLHETAGSTGPIYLGNADFYIFYDPAAFNNPQLFVETNPNPPGGLQGGYCTFEPTNTGGTNSDFCQFIYHSNQSTVFLGTDELGINLNGPAPGTNSAFLDNIARIDNQPSTHRLGSYKITGYNNTPFQLIWDTSVGFETLVFTLADTIPFFSSPVVLTFTDSPIIGTSSNEETDASFSYTVFPNPANDYLTVETEETQEMTYQLFDVHGRLLSEGLFSGQAVVGTDQLAVGTYYLRLSAGEASVVEKVVIAR